MTFGIVAGGGGAVLLDPSGDTPGGRLASVLAELLWPTRCVGCDRPGELLCADCRRSLAWIDQRWACPGCGAPFGHITCTECDHDWASRATVCAVRFGGLPARLVTIFKDHHERRLARVLAAAMVVSLDEASAWPSWSGTPRFDVAETDAVCFVPATGAAFARRGFDHMELVARELCRQTGLPLADVLVRDSARDQRSLGRRQRAANLEGSVRALDDLDGLRLLLVDDVITTGASMRAATRALLARGAASVTCCAFARV